MQAMIFAAGKGTRLKPLTDVIPKALVPVGDKPLIQQVMDRLGKAGVDNTVVNVHHHAKQIVNFLQLALPHYPFSVSISDESEALLETGGGIKKARTLFNPNEPVLIHNCDIISNVDLKQFYDQATGNDATLLVSWRKTQRYLLFDKDMRLAGWTNIATGEVKSPFEEIKQYDGKTNEEGFFDRHPEIKAYAFSGIHCFSPSLFPLMDEWEDRFPIMDFYLANCAKAQIRGVVKEDLKLLDVGKLDTLAQADDFLAAL